MAGAIASKPVQLSVGQIVEDTEAEGPGRRFAVWAQGCSIRCEGCCNPHLFTHSGGERLDVGALVARIARVEGIEGLTVLGGEPFDQPDALAELCEGVKARGLSVMVFTGFTLEQLHGKRALSHIDILVDGPYLQQLPEKQRRWVGSSNQRIHFLTERGRADEGRFAAANSVEIRLKRGELSVNGWPAAAGVVQRWR
jgi:anaerobic ribonucleoside-triphosphate reductase activating protein